MKTLTGAACLELLPALLIALHLGGRELLLVQAADELPRPNFPALFAYSIKGAPLGARRVKLVTEVLEIGHKRVNEEYLDLELGRSALIAELGPEGDPDMIVRDEQGAIVSRQVVLLADSKLNLVFQYRPYVCKTKEVDSKTPFGGDYYAINYKYPVQGEKRRLRLHGLAAMWLYSETQPKSYELSVEAYDSAEGLYRAIHKWTVVDETNARIQFQFASPPYEPKSMMARTMALRATTSLTLEQVKFESEANSRLSRTLVVAAMDYDLNPDEYRNILEIPVGYGCETSPEASKAAAAEEEKKGKAEEEAELEAEDRFWANYLWSSSSVRLELTATRVDQATNARKTDTVYVQLAHLPLTVDSRHYDLMMSKITDRKHEQKVVRNHLFNTKHQIDLRLGTCRTSRLHGAPLAGGSENEAASEDEDLLVRFSNGLALSLERAQLETLFTNKLATFHFIKRVKRRTHSGNQVEYKYSEKTLPNWPLKSKAGGGSSGLMAREIRKHRIRRQAASAEGPASVSAQLESITIWVMDTASKYKLSEIYQVNVIEEYRPLRPWPDVGRLFDVSQECYLDEPSMRAGIDYAWVEFLFPASSHQLDLMMEAEDELKQRLHRELVGELQLTEARLPRLELEFSDEGLIVRALLLDLPAIELLYEVYEGKSIRLNKERGDLSLLAPDLRHCTKLCQLNSCNSLTFCSSTTRACLLGTEVIKSSASQRQEREGDDTLAQQAADLTVGWQEVELAVGCTSYSLPSEDSALLGGELLKRRLPSLLSQLSHQDYDTLDRPQMPDELADSRADSGINSDTEYMALIRSYALQMASYLLKRGNRGPTLMLSMILNDHYVLLLPSHFYVENNPLDEFFIQTVADSGAAEQSEVFDSERVVDYFHEGLPMARFAAYRIPRARRNDEAADEAANRLSVLNGLSFDQCALSCLESQCGTFSHCDTRSECVLATFSTIEQAQKSNLIEQDADCFIAQRDFLKNFQKFPGVAQPSSYAGTNEASSPGDCALSCLGAEGAGGGLEAGLICMSFEFCPANEAETAHHCFLHTARHPEELFGGGSSEAKETAAAGAGAPERGKRATSCDHYERSYLAEFNQVEASQFSAGALAELKTTEQTGPLTPMDCADICLNQMNDCSAFQFCYEPGAKAAAAAAAPQEDASINGGPLRHALSCLFVQSAASGTSKQQEFELLIDQHHQPLDPDKQRPKQLEHNEQCSVFALRADTVQAQLRDLAMGNTMTLDQKHLKERRRAQEPTELSWPGFLFMLFAVAGSATLLGAGLSYASRKSPRLRRHLERARLLLHL